MAEEDEVEVKIFRSQDNEEQDGQDQLTEDKKDVVLEAEMEVTSRPEDIGVKPGAFTKPLPSPSFSFPMMAPMMAYSPSYTNPAVALMAQVMRQPMSPGYMGLPQVTMPMPMSPLQYANAAMAAGILMGPSSPLYANLFNQKLQQEMPLPPNMRNVNPLSQINQMRLPYGSSPITSLANGMPDSLRRTREGKVKKEDHIKKPLNAFMWFMKENRPKILNESGFKEKQSAELNKELGKRWQDLDKEEQQKYFEMAKRDREEHRAKFPNWSARENYAIHKKKKKRRDRTEETTETKKCRARFGTTRTDLWCKFCKRKKKCEWATSVEAISAEHQDRISASGSSGPSPLASSSSVGGPSPLGSSHQDSDTDETDLDAEMDAEEDDEDTTLTHQALQDVVKAESQTF